MFNWILVNGEKERRTFQAKKAALPKVENMNANLARIVGLK